MGMSILQLSGITKRFGPTVALNGVDLEVAPGEVHALVGENGAGKSTLMNILSGALKPDVGTMKFRENAYRPSHPLDAGRQGIVHIHQELSLCPHLSVAENILLGIEPQRRGWVDRGAMLRKAAGTLETFHHPAIQPERRVAELPLAARQIVEICRALARRASLILMDEPTSSLQRADVESLFLFIRRLRQSGISVIYISHFLEEVRQIADRFTVLRDGASVAHGSLSDATDEEIITAMVGRPVDRLFPQRRSKPATECVLQVRGLASLPVLREASFELHRGEILGIGGLIGSGRTEMIRSLFGILPATSGEVTICGRNVAATRLTPQRCIGNGIGYLSEDRKAEGLALNLSIADNTTLTRLGPLSRWGWINLARQAERAAAWITKLNIKARGAATKAAKLSGGNQQKVAIARLLHQDAEIYLLDEPARGVDVGSKAQIYEVIRSLADAGKAVLMVSSDLPELFGICDRLAVMHRGTLSPVRPISEWTPRSALQAAVAGENLEQEPRSGLSA